MRGIIYSGFIINLFLFFFLFGVPFEFIPFNTSKLVFVILILLFAILKIKIKIKKDFIYFSLFFLLLLFFSIIPLLINGTNDFNYIYSCFIFFIEGFIGSILFNFIFFKNEKFNSLLESLVIIAFIQSIIIIIMLFVEPVRNFVFSITDTSAASIFERYDGFRGLGLASSVTYDLSVYLSICLILISYLYINSVISTKKAFCFWIVIMFAVLISGRTGLIGLFLSIIIFFSSWRINDNLIKIIKVFIIFVFFICIIIFTFNIIDPVKLAAIYKILMTYSFEMFVNLKDKGSFSTSSSDVLYSMYFPISSSTFFFGDGYWLNPYNNSFYYMGTDAGYMRIILYGGIMQLIILPLLYVVGFYYIYIKNRGGLKIALTIFSILFIFLICESKGDFLLGSPMNIKLFCMLLGFSILKS